MQFPYLINISYLVTSVINVIDRQDGLFHWGQPFVTLNLEVFNVCELSW